MRPIAIGRKSFDRFSCISILRSCAIAQLRNMDVNNEKRGSTGNSRSLSPPLIVRRKAHRGKSAVDLLGPLAWRQERNPFLRVRRKLKIKNLRVGSWNHSSE